MDPLQTTPAPAAIEVTAPTVIEPAPAVPTSIPSTLSSEPMFGNKLEFLQIGLMALVAASYIMSIIHYRKAIETSNSYQKLQYQINQIKVSMQPSMS